MSETIHLYKCDNCKKVITNPKDGVVVQGNIYVADPTGEGGLIGNNFPSDEHHMDPKFAQHMVNKSAYCTKCFLAAVFPDLKIQQSRRSV